MHRLFPVSVLCAVLSLHLHAQTPQIATITSPDVICDYLVICPDALLEQGMQLAALHNYSSYNAVEHAMAVTLSTVYREFPRADTCPRAFSIWYALQYALNHWNVKPSHVVLLGDDSVKVNGFDTTAGPPKSAGLMPTFYYSAREHRSSLDTTMADTTFDYSDFPYLTVSDTAPPLTRRRNNYRLTDGHLASLPFALGRIPVRSAHECTIYIDKLIRCGHSGRTGTWNNRIILAADDAFQKDAPDHAGMSLPHLGSTEKLSGTSFSGCFISKTYLSSFERSPSGNHEQGRNHFFTAINKGARFAVYFGHGHPDSLTDEGFLRASDTALFTNDTSLPVFFSFSCSNGEFLRKPQSQMCKSYLFTGKGGCIAYVAAPTLTYASSNTKFARAVFSLFDTTGSYTIGQAITYGSTVYRNSTTRYYQVLGDPAIRFSGERFSLSTTGNSLNNGDFVYTTTVIPFTLDSLNFRYQISIRDSVTCLDTLSPRYVDDSIISSAAGSTTGNSITVTIPADAVTAKTRYTLYVWDDQREGRLDTLIPSLTPVLTSATPGVRLPAIGFRRGTITVSFAASPRSPTVTVTLFALNGTRAAVMTSPAANGKAVFNLRKTGLAAGNYLFRVTTGTTRHSGKICFLP